MKNPLGREGNQRAGEGGRNENKEQALQERMSKRRMATTARGELLRLGLQGWALEGSCCARGRRGFKVERSGGH